MLEGIDVSKYQGTIIWKDVAASGQKFGVARCTIGRQTRDDTFARNYERAVAHGIVPGAYHLVTGDSTGAEQAANWKAYLDEVGFDKGLLVLDVEGWASTTNGLEAGTLKATEYLCNWIRNTYNRQPIIYTGVYWRDNLNQHPDNFGSKLWLSYYGTNDPQIYVPKAWQTWKIWQYTSSGSVPGVTGNVDRNKFDGTERQLKTYAGYEWSEMATADEIRTIVAEENAKLLQSFKLELAAVKSDIIAAVNKLQVFVTTELDEVDYSVRGLSDRLVDLSSQVSNLGVTVVSLGDTLGTDSAQVLAAVNALKVEIGNLQAQLDEGVDVDIDYTVLQEYILKLHKHLCLPCVTE